MWLPLNNGELGEGIGEFKRQNIHIDDILKLLLSIMYMNVYLGCYCCLPFWILTITGKVHEIHICMLLC